tara:strand:+ start:50339 stop:51172 length:834 start_codon:yes stop_codon:yes gene_type:complete
MSNLRKFLLLLLLIFTFQLTAQNIYFGIGAGLSNGLAKESYLDFYNIEIIDEDNSLETTEPMSFGSGFNGHLKMGYRFHKDFDFVLEASRFAGGKSSYSKDRFVSDGSVLNERTDLYGNFWSISPSLLFSPLEGRFSPYFRIGPSLNFVKSYAATSHSGTSVDIEILEEYTGDMALGFLGNLGFNYILHENWEFFCELRFHSFSFEPSNGEIIEFRNSGQDELQSLEVAEKETVFKEKISDPNGEVGYTGPNDPLQRLSISQPFSNVQFVIGICFSL